jgi:hypothetical protein
MATSYPLQNEVRELTGVSPLAAVSKTWKPRALRFRKPARRALRRTRAIFAILHQAIVAAKLRRLRREMLLYTGSRGELISSPELQSHSADRDVLKYPQRPLILGEKWDY